MAGRVRSFTTDSEGHLPKNVRLQRETEYEAIPKTKQAAVGAVDAHWLASWVQGAVLGDIRTLRAGVEIYLSDESRRVSSRLGGANFLLAAACFMTLEYAARIFTGDSNAGRNFKVYAKEFLDFEPRYELLADLIWPVFRNGLVHGSWPQSICGDGAEEDVVRIVVGVEPDDPHLAPDRRVKGPNLSLNAMRLADDLEKSIANGLAPWILRAPPEVLLRGAPRLLVVGKNDSAWEPLAVVRQWNAEGAPG